MLGARHAVRLAAEADQPGLVAMLSRAFADDPLLCWAYDRPRPRAAASDRFFRFRTDALLGQGVTWTTPDLSGAAAWALPGQWAVPLRQEARFAASVIPAVRRPITKAIAMAGIEAKHPEAPHLYLSLLGVDPRRQGEGLGTALLAPGLELCDEERWPAYLETETQRNADFYGRMGFAIVDRFDLPKGGPTIWRMWREPH
ncbi:MAG: GNAT family N-acetyltransferase [Patulibacter minatonensis]